MSLSLAGLIARFRSTTLADAARKSIAAPAMHTNASLMTIAN